MQMIFALGSWPRMKAGRTTEVMKDLSCRGGRLMISRGCSPSMLSSRLWTMA